MPDVNHMFLDNKETVRSSILSHHFESDNELDEDYLLSNTYTFSKRLLDLFLCLITISFYLVVFPIIFLGIKLSSKGPVIYKQPRTGQFGTVFICYKFRTMRAIEKRSENGKPIVTSKGDIRIFSFGKFLRKTNLDELPQVFNVLKGEMSFVGPRPYAINECAYWNSTFSDFYKRYYVKPGITGLAQVKGYRGGTHDRGHMRSRLDYDLLYARKHKFLMDIKILFKTSLQMLRLNTNAH